MATKHTNANNDAIPATTDTVTVTDADGNTISLTPIVSVEQMDVLAIQKRTAELLELLNLSHGSRFPTTPQKSILYDKDLEGVPFLVVSPYQLREVADNFSKGQTRRVANLLIQLWNAKTTELAAPKMAQISGGYVLTQLRGMTEAELVGSYLWTLARDEDADPYPRGDGWEQPRKLAPWDAEHDTPAQANDADLTWSERVEKNARKVLDQQQHQKAAEDSVPF